MVCTTLLAVLERVEDYFFANLHIPSYQLTPVSVHIMRHVSSKSSGGQPKLWAT
jgi:hypothetical protein